MIIFPFAAAAAAATCVLHLGLKVVQLQSDVVAST